jgi:competence protein ComEC
MICATGPSSFRAFLMLFLYQLFKLFDYPVSSLNVIGLSGIIILLNDPAIALNAGFQMTFGAVIGILLLNKLLKNKNKILRKFTPLGSLLFIIPITAFHFKRIPLLSVPIGLILSITLIPLIMICMLISLLFYAIQLQFLAAFLLKGLNPLLNLARGITDFLSKNLGTISVEGLARNCLILSIPIVSLFLIMQIAGKKKCAE